MRSFLLQQSQKCPYLLGVIRILNSLCYYFINKKYERFHVNGHTTGLHVHTHLMKKYKSFLKVFSVDYNAKVIYWQTKTPLTARRYNEHLLQAKANIA